MPKFKVKVTETVSCTMDIIVEAPEGTSMDAIRQAAEEEASNCGDGWQEDSVSFDSEAPESCDDSEDAYCSVDPEDD